MRVYRIPWLVFGILLTAGAAAAEPPPLDIDGNFTLVDHTGAKRNSNDFRGRFTLVYFGYTQCPYTCGTALNDISAALDELAGDAGRIAPLFITVDPEQDTPARIAAYLANFHPAFTGLTGSPAQIDRVRAGYRVAARRVADPGAFGRLIDHTPYIYLFGPDGELLTLLPPILPPAHMAEIIRGYLG